MAASHHIYSYCVKNQSNFVSPDNNNHKYRKKDASRLLNSHVASQSDIG